jgi:hypothetical protein
MLMRVEGAQAVPSEQVGPVQPGAALRAEGRQHHLDAADGSALHQRRHARVSTALPFTVKNRSWKAKQNKRTKNPVVFVVSVSI